MERLSDLAPWPEERVRAIEGRIRGSLMRDWGEHVRRRGGEEALERIREATGLTASMLPDSPDVDAMYPASWQILLTDAIVAAALEGDYARLEPLLYEDGLRARARDRVVSWVVGRFKPPTVLRHTPKTHAKLYGMGQARIDLRKRSATITVTGGTLFENPTWRVLQVIAARLMFRALKGECEYAYGEDAGPGAFRMQLAWR